MADETAQENDGGWEPGDVEIDMNVGASMGDLIRCAKASIEILRERWPGLRVETKDYGCTFGVLLNPEDRGKEGTKPQAFYVLRCFRPERDGHIGFKLMTESFARELVKNGLSRFRASDDAGS